VVVNQDEIMDISGVPEEHQMGRIAQDKAKNMKAKFLHNS
jgi:hypothetical protein